MNKVIYNIDNISDFIESQYGQYSSVYNFFSEIKNGKYIPSNLFMLLWNIAYLLNNELPGYSLDKIHLDLLYHITKRDKLELVE